MSDKIYPCDNGGSCPYNAERAMDCHNYCGLGADEDKEFYEELRLEQSETM